MEEIRLARQFPGIAPPDLQAAWRDVGWRCIGQQSIELREIEDQR